MPSELLQKAIDRIQSATKALWVFCGDSITHGALHTTGRRDYMELVEERVRFELGKSQHLFINSGISGDTTQGILRTMDHRILRFKPDVFSLMIGMNDAKNLSLAEYDHNLREIVKRVRQWSQAEILFQTCCAINPEECPGREDYAKYMDTFRDVAGEMDIALIDHHAEWEAVRLEDPGRFKGWMSNEFHPNALGHWTFAEKMLADLQLGALERTPPPYEST